MLGQPPLDWLNTNGVRFLMPFDGTWFYGDALFIIDFIIDPGVCSPALRWCWPRRRHGRTRPAGRGRDGGDGLVIGCGRFADTPLGTALA